MSITDVVVALLVEAPDSSVGGPVFNPRPPRRLILRSFFT